MRVCNEDDVISLTAIGEKISHMLGAMIQRYDTFCTSPPSY